MWRLEVSAASVIVTGRVLGGHSLLQLLPPAIIHYRFIIPFTAQPETYLLATRADIAVRSLQWGQASLGWWRWRWWWWWWWWLKSEVGFETFCCWLSQPLAGLGWAGLGWAGLGWAGLGWAGLGWAGLGWAGLGWECSVRCQLIKALMYVHHVICDGCVEL